MVGHLVLITYICIYDPKTSAGVSSDARGLKFCLPVRGDIPRALASRLSTVQVDKHGITILYHLHQYIPCTSRDILS